jgi:hypothetical protein
VAFLLNTSTVSIPDGKRISLDERGVRKWFANLANEYDSTLGKVPRHHAMPDLVVSVPVIL